MLHDLVGDGLAGESRCLDLRPASGKKAHPGADHCTCGTHHDQQHAASFTPTEQRVHTAMVQSRRVVAVVISRFVVMVGALVLVGLILTHANPTAELRRWDLTINEQLASNRSQRFESIASFVSRVGDTLPVIAFAAVVAMGLALAHRWRATAFIPVALLIEVSTFGAVNYIVRRPRPDVETVGSVPSTFSFPSGHVAATAVCWFGLALLLSGRAPRWVTSLVAAFATVAVVAMGWARVYLGVHHLLDVVFGVAMGLGALHIARTAVLAAAHGSRGWRRRELSGGVHDDRDDRDGEHGPRETEQRPTGDDAEQHDHRVLAERAAVDHRS
jgi:undecaprenyl-diphosphatase